MNYILIIIQVILGGLMFIGGYKCKELRNKLKKDTEMKLYQCEVMDDCEDETILVIAKNEEEARIKIEKMDWSCLMSIAIFEIDEIDGNKISIN